MSAVPVDAVPASPPSAPPAASARAGAEALDPRLFQIATLSLLLVYGLVGLDFEIRPVNAVLIVATALLTQAACARWWKLPRLDLRSPLISALSLCLLLRSNDAWVVVLAAFVAIASKFAVRVNGKHVWNPTNLGVVVAMLTGHGWVSPGQWGNTAWLAFLFACMGNLVVQRAERSDVTWATLAFWVGGLFLRSWMVAEPWTIPVHRLESGAFLLFAFFMISDPRTTPDRRVGRVLYAGLVCGLAWYLQFKLFWNNTLVWSLAMLAPLTVLIDRGLPGVQYLWPSYRVGGVR